MEQTYGLGRCVAGPIGVARRRATTYSSRVINAIRLVHAKLLFPCCVRYPLVKWQVRVESLNICGPN